MPTTCSDGDRWLAPGAPDSTAWQSHRAGCASCRAQWAAHTALLSALDAAPPAPGARFTETLMDRLAQEEAALASARSRSALWALRLYWLAVSLLAIGIVARIDWHAALAAHPWLLCLLLAPLLTAPLFFLALAEPGRPASSAI